jgi:hypothetical protein
LKEISVICVINGTSNAILGTGHLYGDATNALLLGALERVTFKSTNTLIINVSSNFEEEVSQNLLFGRNCQEKK